MTKTELLTAAQRWRMWSGVLHRIACMAGVTAEALDKRAVGK